MLQKIREYIQYKIDRFLKDIGIRKKITVNVTNTERKIPLTNFGGVNSISDNELRLKILENKLKELEKKK